MANSPPASKIGYIKSPICTLLPQLGSSNRPILRRQRVPQKQRVVQHGVEVIRGTCMMWKHFSATHAPAHAYAGKQSRTCTNRNGPRARGLTRSCTRAHTHTRTDALTHSRTHALITQWRGGGAGIFLIHRLSSIKQEKLDLQRMSIGIVEEGHDASRISIG